MHALGPYGPTNSPVRLGVSPTATSTPTGVFNQWFEALFPHAGTLGCAICCQVHQLLSHPPAAALSTRLHNLPPRWVRQLPPCRKSSLPWLPVSAPPTGLGEWFFFISLVVGLHTVRFSVSSGCFLFLSCFCPCFGCAKKQCVYLCFHFGQKPKNVPCTFEKNVHFDSFR